jgi:hypothetical protein
MFNQSFVYKVIISCSVIISLDALKIDRVILATNDNPTYIDFWPYAAKAWTQLIGVKPTLALIAHDHVKVDESLGEVIRFKPIPGIATGLQAQVIRLLLPAYFPNQTCIISDIDQLPIKESYFTEAIAHISKEKFVIYNNKCYGFKARFPMCYIAAQGQTFKDIFRIRNKYDIPFIIKRWARLGLGFNTDELVLYRYLTTWKRYASRCTKLGDTLGPRDKRRINRKSWEYDPELVKKGFYVDAHLLRPYSKYKSELDRLALLAGVKL